MTNQIAQKPIATCMLVGYVARGSTAFKVQKDQL